MQTIYLTIESLLFVRKEKRINKNQFFTRLVYIGIILAFISSTSIPYLQGVASFIAGYIFGIQFIKRGNAGGFSIRYLVFILSCWYIFTIFQFIGIKGIEMPLIPTLVGGVLWLTTILFMLKVIFHQSNNLASPESIHSEKEGDLGLEIFFIIYFILGCIVLLIFLIGFKVWQLVGGILFTLLLLVIYLFQVLKK